LFRKLWEREDVTWSGQFRPSLINAKALPRPLQQRIRIWHGSATSKESVELAARYGDPIFSANVTNPIEPYAELVRHYRQRWEFYGHRPEDALVGAGTAGFHVATTSQQAVDEFRPAFHARLSAQRRVGMPVMFDTIEDFVDRSSALVGSPQQVIDKVSRYHEQLGHEVIHLSAEADGVTAAQKRQSLELFQSDVAPALREQIPSRPLISQSTDKGVFAS
jgi:alkanesulfonate monooxygenase SsuD/methylene tetrahydromethanopterin reductase-like flavin-dependent oxidoreductase (luciferase family)